MSARKPKIEYYWSHQVDTKENGSHVREWRCNWRLVGVNGEIMCQSTQGFRDKTDARRSVDAVSIALGGWSIDDPDVLKNLREVGPGRKP